MNDKDKRDVEDFLTGVEQHFYRLMEKARHSGAVGDDVTAIELARCVLVVCAEDYGPMGSRCKSIMNNLRFFV